jgi:hypothetical protein
MLRPEEEDGDAKKTKESNAAQELGRVHLQWGASFLSNA